MKKTILVYIVLLCGCASLPMISSVSQKEPANNDYRYYNAESKVLYKVTNDEKDLHIILNTNEPASILRILKTGLTIYFDVTGKKKKEIFVHYPFKFNNATHPSEQKKEDGNSQSKRSLDYLVSQIPHELIFSAYGNTDKIDLDKIDADIKDSITVIKDNEITYELTIPLSCISNKGALSLSDLSVGVVSGKFEIPGGNGGDAVVQKTLNGRAGSVSPGGIGSSSGTDNEIPAVGNNLGDMDMLAMATAIDFWFKVVLFK